MFRLDDFVGHGAQPLPYARKDFYKISLIIGQNTYHYADKSIANPRVPYDWEPRGAAQTGFFCIFTEAFLQRYLGSQLTNFPVFQPGGQPVFFLADEQLDQTRQLFQKMFTELDSSYTYR